MQAVKGKDTGPEMTIRRLLHSAGYRYRVHRCDLPGCPDIVFSRARKAIFIHGCFWHGHDCARGKRVPKTNTRYWVEKVARNRSRDARVQSELCLDGWGVFVIWECELADRHLLSRVNRFLSQPGTYPNALTA